MIVSSRSWHIACTASSSLLLNEDDDDAHFLSFVLMCVDIVECELARTAHNFGVVISWHGVKNLFLFSNPYRILIGCDGIIEFVMIRYM